MAKKITYSVVFFILALTSATAFASFTDVDESHQNADAIEFVQDEEIVEGYEDGTYKPEKLINRAEFTKIIIESEFDDVTIDNCVDENEDSLIFTDVPLDEWYSKYVCVAFMQGIVGGYPDGTYGPALDISIVEAAKIISNTLRFETTDDDIWYKPYMEELGSRNALPTSITSFDQNITRGEMAEMIYRLISEITVKNSTSYGELAGEEPADDPDVVEQTVDVSAFEFDFNLSSNTLKAGEVTFTVMNDGAGTHDFVIEGTEFSTQLLSSGESEVLIADLEPGTYIYYCSVGSHRTFGMEGTFTVTN